MFDNGIVLLAAGLGLGFANTLASSGSAISLPILLGIGLAPETANGTNRVAVLVGALTATAAFARSGRIQWTVVAPLMASSAAGALIGVGISEVIPPRDMRLAIVAAECVALALLLIRPSRWVQPAFVSPRVGPLQLALVLLIGIWIGFIVLDGGTYLLVLLVLSVRFDLLGANAAKAAIMAATAAVSLPVLAVGHHVEWGAASLMSAGALLGGLVGARIALFPEAARWIYRLIVVILVGELVRLALGGVSG